LNGLVSVRPFYLYNTIYVHVKTKREEVIEIKPGYFDLWIKEPAERGLANKKVLEILRMHLNTNREMKIVSRHYHPKKMVSISE